MGVLLRRGGGRGQRREEHSGRGHAEEDGVRVREGREEGLDREGPGPDHPHDSQSAADDGGKSRLSLVTTSLHLVLASHWPKILLLASHWQKILILASHWSLLLILASHWSILLILASYL